MLCLFKLVETKDKFVKKHKQMMKYFVYILPSAIMAVKRYNVITDLTFAEGDVGLKSKENVSIKSLFESAEDRLVKNTQFGFTLDLTEGTQKKLKKHPKIILIEEDKPVKTAVNTFSSTVGNIPENILNSTLMKSSFATEEQVSFVLQKVSSWGLSKISGHANGYYEYIEGGGKDVNVYILDTGIDEDHPEFEGRARMGYNAVEYSQNTDENGHGTHCAGIIGSKTFGVAKGVNLIGVKVLDREGQGMISKIVEGIDFVIRDIVDQNYNFGSKTRFLNERDIFKFPLSFLNNPTTPKRIRAVVNMSIGGERSKILNHVIREASVKYGIHFSTAAGNENKDACEFSPSSSSMGLTIGASDADDRIARFSNSGVCVDLYAPGTFIRSTWPNNGTRIASGTSMATPHVAGIMAIYLGLSDFEPDELKERIVQDSSDAIDGLKISFWPFSRQLMPFASLKKLYDRIKTRNLQINAR